MTRRLSIAGLICSLLLLATGVYGVYFQGRFWASGAWNAANHQELAIALGAPAILLFLGIALNAGFLLGSPLTAHLSAPRRVALFFCLVALSLLACLIAASAAGKIAAQTLQTT